MLNKTVLIFGVFDGIHEGHLYFIKEARKHGTRLVAVVTRDEIVLKLKGKLPKKNEVERINDLLKINDIDTVFLGDKEIETYNILKEVKPDIVFLGYDQKDLLNSLNKMIKTGSLSNMDILEGKAYKPETFHSSILNK